MLMEVPRFPVRFSVSLSYCSQQVLYALRDFDPMPVLDDYKSSVGLGRNGCKSHSNKAS